MLYDQVKELLLQERSSLLTSGSPIPYCQSQDRQTSPNTTTNIGRHHERQTKLQIRCIVRKKIKIHFLLKFVLSCANRCVCVFTCVCVYVCLCACACTFSLKDTYLFSFYEHLSFRYSNTYPSFISFLQVISFPA